MMPDHITANRQYYNERFGPQSQHLNEEEQRRQTIILEQVKKLNLRPDARIADFGCGRGWLSSALSTHGQVTGFDLSEKAVQNAQQNFPHCTFISLDAEGTIPSDMHGQFDLVVSSEVIEHTSEQTKYLYNAGMLLKNGGTFLITTPNGKWKEIFYTSGREKWKQPLENWLRIQDLKKLLQSCGLEVAHGTTFNSEWIFDFKPDVRSVLILKNTVTRKLLKLTFLYQKTIIYLNGRGYGLNILMLAKKI